MVHSIVVLLVVVVVEQVIVFLGGGGSGAFGNGMGAVFDLSIQGELGAGLSSGLARTAEFASKPGRAWVGVGCRWSVQ